MQISLPLKNDDAVPYAPRALLREGNYTRRQELNLEMKLGTKKATRDT